MDPVTLGFLTAGALGAGLLLLALVVGDLLHLGGLDADGPFSFPAVAAFIGGVGFAGAAASALLPIPGDAVRAVLSAGIGLLGALPLAWFAVRLSRGLMNMRTDRTLSDDDVAGALGVVITRIPATGYGEVRVRLAGQDLKYSARSDVALERGAQILVVRALSSTAVEVVGLDEHPLPPPD
ncbi:hypothetical protein [Cumulibacter manganitolerans]|uniref:hypothetical protein n=1 Tax=Cumulibacter manganitolerans TaxID=1884992 RepID=UPI0012960626|nr:hypothetical protein [Cumulibacter manganitolerans]